MEPKSTDELSHEIKAARNIEDYLKKNKEHMIMTDLSEHLNMLLSLKKPKKAGVLSAPFRSRDTKNAENIRQSGIVCKR